MRPASELLSTLDVAELSLFAVALYVHVWNELDRRSATEMTITNSRLAQCLRLDIRQVAPAQAELVRRGLLHIEQDHRAHDAEDVFRFKYEFFDDAPASQ